jgi:hypothetical protein
VLVKSRLEKIDFVERALGVAEQLFIELDGGWRSILARRRKNARRVGGCDVQLVEAEKYRLREI